MPKFVIFWTNPDTAQPDWETFESFIGAMTALNSYAASYPWNTYWLARVETVRTKTMDKQPMPKVGAASE